MKKQFIFLSFVVILIFLSLVFIVAQDDASVPQPTTGSDTTEPAQENSDDVLTETQETEENNAPTTSETTEQTNFNVDAGITPDSPLYFIDDLAERVTIGDNPERALDYREEKIAEAIVMVNEGRPEQARRVLDRAMDYGNVLEKEVSPEIRGRVQQSADQVQNVLNNMKDQTSGDEWGNVRDGFDANIEKGKKIETASELVAKISELCEALARLDPLQYQDTCRSKDDSPKWMREQDQELTAEQQKQAEIFFNKLSQCFETPKQCDCKGMGVQKFEDFCLEKSVVAVKCEGGDEEACKSLNSGADPTELLPDYLISTFKKIESKYMKSEMNMYMPPECEEKGATSPEECGKIMFSLNAPQECIDAGLTGKSKEDEIKCREIMFKSNAPQECIDAGISSSDKDAPRKCAKIMFSINSPQNCIDAGITGESRDDEKKCRQVMESQGGQMQGSQTYAPKFNRDCKAIQDINEKMKCFEEFYNNAQVQVREDFAPGTGPGGERGQCQTQEQIERLRQDCKNRAQDSVVEDRGGCPWVICVGGDYRGDYAGNNIVREQRPETFAGGTGSGGMKCPDGICDSYERMNSFACPEDCGGARQVTQEPKQDYQQPNEMQTENRIDQPQQPYQEPQEPIPSPESAFPTESSPSDSSESSGGESAPVTGEVIGFIEPTGTSGNAFWDYWFSG